jgi:hypothetical protein
MCIADTMESKLMKLLKNGQDSCIIMPHNKKRKETSWMNCRTKLFLGAPG